jgi:hypothetical protein
VVKDTAGEVLASCPVATDGSFHCPIEPPLADGAKAEVSLVDQAGNASDPVEIVADSSAPGSLVPAPSDGKSVSGEGEAPGDTITVTDGDGNVLCTTQVRDDFAWECQLHPSAAEGEMVVIAEEDAAHNKVERPWRVGLPRLSLAHASRHAGEVQTAVGENFQPGETVSLTALGVSLSAVADDDGRVTFEWTVTAGAEGEREVTATGAESGRVEAAFELVPRPAPPIPSVRPSTPLGTLPFTGAQGLGALVGLALGALVAGCLLIAGGRRRAARRQG